MRALLPAAATFAFVCVGLPLVDAHGGMMDDFHSPMLGQGESFTAAFTVAASHPYHCHPHPNMEGMLTVSETAPEGNLTIEIRAFQFLPADAKVRPNSTVTWRNMDSTPHTVERNDPSKSHDHGTPGAGIILVLGALLVGLAIRRRTQA